ncbi:hypothetical protein BH24ACT3_BH24ACT3_06390 [soil metagenome]
MDDKPLRALFVNENIGGHATLHHHLRTHLGPQLGVAASVYDVQPRGPVRRAVGARVQGLARHDLDLQPLRAQLALSATVRRELRRRRGTYDVLHVYTHNAGLLAIGALQAGPAVVGLDATNAQSYRLLPGRRPGLGTPAAIRVAQVFERRVHAAATLILSKSHWAAASLRSDYGIEEDRLRVVPLGIEVPVEPRAPVTAQEPRRIAFIGQTMDRKGGWRLLDLWRRELRPHCRLTLVTPELVRPEPGLEVLNDVTVGDLRLEALLGQTSVLACPSEMDTFGYAAMEAMAMGVPVVADDIGAFREIIEDGRSGFVVPAGDDRSLGGALHRLVTDHHLNVRMGRAARERMIAHFNARRTTGQLAAVLREAVARHR